MRDPERIDRVCDKLKELWKFYPDQRLTQLYYNFVVLGRSDYFNQEDDVSERNIDDMIKVVKDILTQNDSIAIDMEKDSITEYYNGSTSKF